MTQEKRKQIQQRAREAQKTKEISREESQLQAILDDDSEIAQFYQEAFSQEKNIQEKDLQRIEDVHARFDKFADKRLMWNKIKDKRYDLPGEIPDTEDEAWTTDFEIDVAPEYTDIYR